MREYSQSEDSGDETTKPKSHSNTQSAADSKIRRHGNVYYTPDESYDKRVYENTPLNYVKIIFALLFFWAFNGLHWWACFEFGIIHTELFMIYSIVAFCCSVIFGAGMLISGSGSNRYKRQYEFLRDKIQEKRSEKLAKAEAEKQIAAYAKKIQTQDTKKEMKKVSGIHPVSPRS